MVETEVLSMEPNEPPIPDPDDPLFTADPPSGVRESVQASRTETYLLDEILPDGFDGD